MKNMAYISYFDLLGTRGFCENPNVYYSNIQEFYNTIKQESCFLNNCGKVGIFSDCAYAESSDLKCLLDFIVAIRDRLLTQGLFFNAVIKEGELNIQIVPQNDNQPAFGVVFNNSSIADLYISQTQFKGIGIFVEPSLVNEVKEHTNYETTNCIYVEGKMEDGKYTVHPMNYTDIRFKYDNYPAEMNHTLNIFYRSFYSAYVKSPEFGMYYISAISNFLRSCDNNFKWNFEKNEFTTQPIAFKTVENMLKIQSNDLSKLLGIEYLALIMLDIVYNSSSLTDDDKKKYTQKLVEIECVKNKFIHSLNDVPKSIFTENETTNNRELFISYCQSDLSDNFAEKILT